jgi:tetratricopeptide (TPR) repeat protein
MTLSKIFVATCLAVLLPVAPALAEWTPSPAEMAALPAYCTAKFNEGANPEAAKVWRENMGSNFTHIHHYCAGLNFVNRARGMASDKDKLGTLGAAMTNFDYILQYTQADFYLRPEVLMNRGIALSMLHRDGEAIGELLKSIELDPKQPRAYVTLADLYEKQKNRSKALDTVTAGLRHNPDTKSLQRRYTELGGKLPYPAPVQPAAAADSTAPATVTPTPAGADPAGSAAGASATATPTVTPAVDPAAAPKIGSPKNPYCRFCPD